VFPDANEPWVVDGILASMRFTRQSQSCTAGSRLFVHDSIFDDFVHVVDTLRFLVAPSPDDLEVVARRREDGALARIAITLRQGDRIGVGIMDRDSGQTVEALEAMAPGRARRVTDLVDVVDRVGGRAIHVQPDNWASVSQQRGFTAMIAWLLGSVRAGTVLDGADALATHELCEVILGRVDAASG
jgi:virulence factor